MIFIILIQEAAILHQLHLTLNYCMSHTLWLLLVGISGIALHLIPSCSAYFLYILFYSMMTTFSMANRLTTMSYVDCVTVAVVVSTGILGRQLQRWPNSAIDVRNLSPLYNQIIIINYAWSCGVSSDLHVAPYLGAIFTTINSWPQVFAPTFICPLLHSLSLSLLVSNPFSCCPSVCCTITVLTRTGQLFLLLFCCNISELCSNFPSFSFSPSFHYFSLFLPHIHLIIVQLFPNNWSRSTSEHNNKRVVDTTLVTQTLADLESNDHG